MIEAIQKNFTIWALELTRDPITYKYPPYDQRLEILNMEKLTRRMANAAIFFIYDILTEKLDAPILRNCIVINDNPRNLMGRELIFIETYNRKYLMMLPSIFL